MVSKQGDEVRYEQQVYRSIVLALANGFCNDRVRAGLVLNEDIRRGLCQQINSLLNLERKFKCDLNSTRYAQVFAQTLANTTGTKATVVQSESTATEIEAKYNQFLTLLENELTVKPNILRDDNVSLQVSSFQSLRLLSPQEAKKILSPKEPHPQAHVDQPSPNYAGKDQTTKQASNSHMNTNFARRMFWNSTQIPGGNFPRHPLYDPKFYPFKTKSYYFPILKGVVTSVCILSSLLSFVVMILCMLKSIPFTHPGWSVNNNGFIVTSGGKASHPVINFYLSPLKGIIGYNWFSVMVTLIPGMIMAFGSFYNQQWDRHRYTIGYFRVGISVVFYAISLYSLLVFLIPVSFQRYLASLFQNKPSRADLSFLLDTITNNAFYKVVWVLSVLTTVLVFVSIASLVVLLFLNPKIDRSKLIKANGEYQKAVAARYNGQEYEIDSSLFDPVPVKKHKPKTS